MTVEVDGNTADRSRARVTGTLSGPGTLTVTVTDRDSREFTKSYVLHPRSKCWLSYISLENASPTLHVIDPILTTFSAPEPRHNEKVANFQFSTDGRYLAYRFGVDPALPDSGHLSLLDLSTGRDDLLDFSEDGIVSYSWSDDSGVLAVAFRQGSLTYLGGVRLDQDGDGGTILPEAGSNATDGGPAISSATLLRPAPAAVESPLLWFGGDYVAFYGPSSSGVPWLVAGSSKLDGDTFREPLLSFSESSPPLQLQAAADGFFSISLAMATVLFNSTASTVPADHRMNVVSPSGAFTTPLTNDGLALFRAADDPGLADAWAEATGCSKLLAWAKEKERLACVAEVTDAVHGETHGEVRIFDLDVALRRLDMSSVVGYCVKSSNPSASIPPCAATEYDYTIAKSNVRRRALSPSGRWFAFATIATEQSVNDDYLYWADLQTDPKQLKGKHWSSDGGAPGSSQVELAFSSDENLLLEQRGASLAVHDLQAPLSTRFVLSTDLKPTLPCSEDFASAPNRWCGNIVNEAPFVWATDPKVAVFKTVNALTVVDFSLLPTASRRVFTMVDCNEQCSGQFAFQP